MNLGEIQPASSIGPSRSPNGQTLLGRLTTTEEQRAEALERMAEAAAEHKDKSVRATVIWSRGEPTVLDATFVVEHVDGKRVWLLDTVNEFSLTGAEFVKDEVLRVTRLKEELADLHERSML